MNVAILPCGESVKVPVSIDSQWFTDRKTGYVDPNFLAPYVKQPRLYMDPVKLDELKASVASQGVRESIVVTPMKDAPWAVVEPGNEGLPFLIVSGHRRRESAIAGCVQAVPIDVRVYKNEAAFDEDAATLNDHRQDLSDVEEGWRYRKQIEAGGKITHISSRTGHAVQWIHARVHLTYLCPKIQKLISPQLKRRDRLATGFAAAMGSKGLGRGFSFDEAYDFDAVLAELGEEKAVTPGMTNDEKRFLVQHAYLSFCKKKGWKGVVSEKFVRTGEQPSAGNTSTYAGGASAKTLPTPVKSKVMRHRMIDWFVELNEMGFFDKTTSELIRLFSNSVRVDLEAMAQRLEMAAETLREIAGKKPVLSEAALGGQTRPEQKIFKDD